MKKSKTKIAIPIRNSFVSSVFDFAHQLLVIDAEDKKEISRSQIQLNQKAIQQRVSRLVELNVNVLICGGISRPLASMLIAFNIEVVPFVTGTVDEVLNAYFNDRLSEPQFLQPGCEPGARKGFGRRRRGCQWRGGQR